MPFLFCQKESLLHYGDGKRKGYGWICLQFFPRSTVPNHHSIISFSHFFRLVIHTKKCIKICPLCNVEIESPPHLLLHCRISWNVWSQIVEWWGLVWVCPYTVYELMCWWFSNKFKSVEKGCWEICFYAVLWSLWLQRNKIVFNAQYVDIAEMVDSIKTKVALWTKVCFNIQDYSVEDIKRCLQGVRKLKMAKSPLY